MTLVWLWSRKKLLLPAEPTSQYPPISGIWGLASISDSICRQSCRLLQHLDATMMYRLLSIRMLLHDLLLELLNKSKSLQFSRTYCTGYQWTYSNPQNCGHSLVLVFDCIQGTCTSLLWRRLQCTPLSAITEHSNLRSADVPGCWMVFKSGPTAIWNVMLLC